MLGLLGLDLGPLEGMLPAHPDDNARGYWEQREILEINEEILSAFGGTWGRPPKLPSGWEHSPEIAAARARARRSLGEMFGTRERHWAWKDPRAAVTLPFWRELVGDMGYVLCVRNPADVAESLAKRDTEDLSFEDSVALWLHYTRAALENTQGPRLILPYEDYFTDTGAQIRRLARFACGQDVSLSEETLQRAQSFVDPDLWHNRNPGDGLDQVAAFSPEAATLYQHLVTGDRGFGGASLRPA
jgi:hypothetical protein